MIIVSQDGNIVNFDRVSNVYRQENVINYQCPDIEDFWWRLGVYATEERAKEVLKEITECYTNTEQYKCLSSIPNCNPENLVSILNKLVENAFIYEMPKE